MKKIFDRIDNINWKKLEHAYGNAEDVPEQLKWLLDGNEKEGGKALSAFFGNIYHQGTIYEATSFAVPFLIHAISNCHPNLKSDLLELLICISNGMSYNIQHQSIWENGGIFDDGRTITDEYKKETREQLHWVEQGILAVWNGWDEFASLLNDNNPDIRVHIPLLLVSLTNGYYCPKDKNIDVVQKELFDLLHEKSVVENNGTVKASIIQGMSYLDIPLVKKISLLKYYQQEEEPVIKITAAYCLIGLEQNETSIMILKNALAEEEKTEKAFQSHPWFDMKVSFFFLQSLCELPVSHFDLLWDVFENKIKSTHKFGTEYIVSPIVRFVFENKKIDEAPRPFTQAQKKVLLCILDTPTLWDKTDGNTSGEFRKWGLERDKKFIEDLIRD